MNNNMLSYLSDLENNNNRDWYHEHKKENKEVFADFENLIQQLILEIGKQDASILHNNPKDLTFKMVRDTRFSNDKSPYKPVLRCHIAPAGKLPVPVGYFLYISPGNRSFLGGGLFADMFKNATDMIRKHIYENSEEFLNIINDPKFSENFKIDGTSLKNVPKEYSADSPAAEYLKYKSWFIEYYVNDEKFENISNFVKFAAEKFLLMKPFNDFLNRALKDFVMPER